MINSIKFIFLFIILTLTIYPQNFWEKINSPTTKKLNSIVFIDSLTGWVAGDSGLIIHTTNGGAEWETQFTNDSLNVINLFFLNDQIGWGAAWRSYYEPFGTYILKTSNGGINWNSEYFRVGESYVNSLYFLDTLTGFAVGYPNVFHKTIDGGINWTKVNLDSSLVSGSPPYNINFYSSQYGFACGGVRDIAGVIWKTTDGGENWSTVVSTLISEPLYDLHIFDSLNVISIGGDPEFGASQVISTDGGVTWEYTNLGIYWFPVDLGFRKSTEGWAPMGAQKKFLYTTDFGNSWTEINTPDSCSVLYICFPDSIHGYGIGENGEIIKYHYQLPDFVETELDENASFYLTQNYPNPFNPSTTIKYDLPNTSEVSLIVYDLLGRKVKELIITKQQAGRYEIQFDASNLASGVYIYQLIAEKYLSSKKMILLK